MKQILIITRITGNETKDEFPRFYKDRKKPVRVEFNDIRLDICSGFELYDDEDEIVAKNIRSRIDPGADNVLVVFHSSEFESVKSELLSLQDGLNWQVREYSSAKSGNYGEIAAAFQNVLADASYVDVIDKLFSPDNILEAKLELLHRCIFPDTIPSGSELDPSLKAFSGSFDGFIARVKEIRAAIEQEGQQENTRSELTWDNSDYIKALTELRDSLLGA